MKKTRWRDWVNVGQCEGGSTVFMNRDRRLVKLLNKACAKTDGVTWREGAKKYFGSSINTLQFRWNDSEIGVLSQGGKARARCIPGYDIVWE